MTSLSPGECDLIYHTAIQCTASCTWNFDSLSTGVRNSATWEGELDSQLQIGPKRIPWVHLILHYWWCFASFQIERETLKTQDLTVFILWFIPRTGLNIFIHTRWNESQTGDKLLAHSKKTNKPTVKKTKIFIFLTDSHLPNINRHSTIQLITE